MNVRPLRINTRATAGAVLIEAVGEVDLNSALQLREPVMEAIARPEKPAISVDLRRLSFLDSAGMAVLVEACRRLTPEGRRLRVALAPGRQPERMLHVGHFDKLMDVVYDLGDLDDLAGGAGT